MSPSLASPISAAEYLTPSGLRAALHDGQEIAVLDVREAGRIARRGILYGVPAPLWRLEILVDRLVPRRDTRIVLIDDDESLAQPAAAKLIRLGWSNIAVLAGGIDAWQAAGLEIFTGTNIPGKAFGEVIEHQKHTPWIDADELQARIQRGDNLVVVDSRTPEEFRNFSLPFAHSLPGAELVYRIGDIAPDPETLVVVNCAGRTRSIVGAQTLIDAGIPNPVVSLKNGTMAWLLSGRELAYGRPAALAEPSGPALLAARGQAGRVARKAGVRHISDEELRRFEAEQEQTTLYRFDIRGREEYLAGHLPGWRWAPGGQLVQATDEYLATRRARVVLADWDGVRALTTGAWLAQLGAVEVFLYQPGQPPVLETGAEPIRTHHYRPPAPQISAQAALALARTGKAVLFDIEYRAAYERRHAQGARFSTPERLAEFLPENRDATIVLFSADGVLAQIVAAELGRQTGRDARAATGGTHAWAAAGLPTGSGADGVLTGDDDRNISPYNYADLQARDQGFLDYLDWELGLVAQLDREGSPDTRLIAS